MRFFILLCALCLLMACQPEQKLLTVEDLHFPIDPERDALRENGIREVIEICVSEGGCHPRSDETGHDTILRISHLDTLGSLILEDPENMFGALTEKHAYNHLGWEVVDYEYNDHHFFYLYSFFPKSNRLVQYLYYYQGFYITIWQFDKDGKPECNFDAYSHTTFTYDELGRIVSTKKL